MGSSMDPDFLNVAGPMLEAMEARGKLALHDIESRRTRGEGYRALFAGLPEHPEWVPKKFTTTTTTGSGRTVEMYWFANKAIKSSPAAGPAILHFHGGGYISGSVEIFERYIAHQAALIGIPILSVDYRLAPESTGTEIVEEGYAGLLWLHANAKELNVDPTRIIIRGESAGGGLAAGVALYARDQELKPPLKKQILIYPMLDDRNIFPKESRPGSAAWDYDDSRTAWTAVLGKDLVGTEHGNVYAAPAHAKDLTGLPSTYIDVGGLDIFCEENLEFAHRLSVAGVAVEFHLHPGVPHGFDVIGPRSAVAQRAIADQVRACQGA